MGWFEEQFDRFKEWKQTNKNKGTPVGRATNSMIDFLKNSGIDPLSRQGQYLIHTFKKGGQPYVKQYEEGKLGEETSKRIGKDVKGDRAFYSHNTPYRGGGGTQDTLHVVEGNISDYLAEIAHGYQFKNPDESAAVGDSLISAAGLQHAEDDDGLHEHRYKKPGNVEYQAHQVIDPALESRLYSVDSLSDEEWENFEEHLPAYGWDNKVRKPADKRELTIGDWLWNKMGW
jgi:hypothetical protein